MPRNLRLVAFACIAAAPARAADPPRPVAVAPVVAELVKLHGEAQRPRIARGVAQAASLWRPEDGDFAAFARQHFLADPARVDQTFARFETTFEALDGHFLEIGRELRRPTDLDVGPLLPVDPLLGGFDPEAHLTEDLFTSKLGFAVLLNFPLTTLDERMAGGRSWSRRQWAEARLTDRFARRVPAEVNQGITRAAAAAELYISEYNIWMHHLVDDGGQRHFPRGLRLISHWNLRDELKSAYADPGGLARQRMIVKVMDRIVTQTIPAAVIDNPRLDWNPFTNQVTAAPAAEVEADAPARPASPDGKPEPNTRYAHLLALFRAARAADPYSPTAPTALLRSFEEGELPEARVVELLGEVLSSPLVPRVAAEIERRLGRKLEPADLWYAGFQARGRTSEAELDAQVRKRYATSEAFARDIPRILARLGFSRKQIALLAGHIVVDPSRGAGHALEARRRGDASHLRTRVEKGGMNYKGYNIAVHELGHNVEQVFSLHLVDHTLLQGVPITAITEALAFVFQARDLELLGRKVATGESAREDALGAFWSTWEIAGVALVEIKVWHWMYDHPDATAAELGQAVLDVAREVWNQRYAPVLGGKDSVQLAIYSHMLSTPIYLYNYPLGHIIAFQIEEHIARQGAGKLGAEFERMTRHGRVTPDLWMENATGAPIATAPLLRATERALGSPPRHE